MHNRTSVRLTLALAPLALAACAQASSAPITPATPGAAAAQAAPEVAAAPAAVLPSRTFTFTYAVTVPAPAAGTTSLDVWVPIARDEAGVQTVQDVQVTPPLPITTEPIFGNRMVHLTVSNPTGPIEVKWTARITRTEDRGQGTGPDSPRYLLPTRLIPVDGKAAEVARTLGLATVATDEAKTKRIYDDVLSGMEYDKVAPGWGKGDFARALAVCKGNCTDFHARFIGVARSAGVPTRFTMGIPMKADATGAYNGYHCWAHWLDRASGTWEPVDISEADKVAGTDPAKAAWFYGHLDPHRVSLTYGHDLTLAPAQQGEPLGYFVFPYVEADGAPVTLEKSAWNFTWADVK